MIDAGLVASAAVHGPYCTYNYYHLTALGVAEAVRLEIEGETLYLPQVAIDRWP